MENSFILLLLYVVLVSATQDCRKLKTCKQCFQTVGCSWCFEPGELGKCSSNEESSCSPGSEYFPESDVIIEQDEDYSDIHNFKPQIIRVKLGVGQKVNFTVKYKHKPNMQLDLYYLMDMSNTMSDDINTLSSLGETVADAMEDLTDEFRIGFGTFVDKTTLPYVDGNYAKRCPTCEAPYSYKNRLSLTDDIKQFTKEVNATIVSTNIDNLEGGFDALMQIMVCGNDIGWRNESIKLLIYASDSGFHYAGNGMLGGIYRPNDMGCHLVNNSYSLDQSLTTDYPSISQINEKASENHVFITFAVTSNILILYEKVAKLISSSSAQLLSPDSSNIIELITKKFERIIKEATLEVKGEYKHLKIMKDDKCSNEELGKCSNLTEGDKIKIQITIELLECSKSSTPDIYKIKSMGVNDEVVIYVQQLCDCDCENNIDKNAVLCSGNGNSTCGTCTCNVGYWGETCKCSGKDIGEDSKLNCRAPGKNSTCSGQGYCSCGECKCNSDDYYGTYCECSDVNCPKKYQKLCSGNGDCECGECSCLSGWSKKDCSCIDAQNKCIDPESGMLCSENGNCLCNSCECEYYGIEAETKYDGIYCESCGGENCKCKEYLPCVRCQLDSSKCNSECSEYNTTMTSSIDDKDGKLCETVVDECTAKFAYKVKNQLVILDDLDCGPVPIGVIIGSIVGSIIGVGILTLLMWRSYASYQDKLEVEKFDKWRKEEAMRTTENPMYVPATKQTSNPLYVPAE